MSFPYASRAAERLRPETPKSPWSRRILFPAPSRRFRIVPVLVGLIGCLYSVLWLSFRYLVLFRSSLGFRFPWFRSLVSLGALRSVRLMAGFPFSSLFFSWWPFRLNKGGRMFRFRLHRRRVLRSALFVLRSRWSSVFLQVVRSFVFPFPLFRWSPSLPRFSFNALFLFCLRFFFFVFSLSAPPPPFLFFLDPSCLSVSTSLHCDAPSGGGAGRAAWPRPTPSALVWPSRRTCRAWRRCRCVSCWRRPCPGPGPA